MIDNPRAEAFARTWLSLLDTLAPLDAYLKYLPDGDFEQWSYPEVEIKNVAHLAAFFEKTWGMIQSQSNQITGLSSVELPDGRVQVEVDVNWSATTSGGQVLARPLHYSLTIGAGASSGDTAGAHPKVHRYRMTRPQAT